MISLPPQAADFDRWKKPRSADECMEEDNALYAGLGGFVGEGLQDPHDQGLRSGALAAGAEKGPQEPRAGRDRRTVPGRDAHARYAGSAPPGGRAAAASRRTRGRGASRICQAGGRERLSKASKSPAGSRARPRKRPTSAEPSRWRPTPGRRAGGRRPGRRPRRLSPAWAPWSSRIRVTQGRRRRSRPTFLLSFPSTRAMPPLAPFRQGACQRPCKKLLTRQSSCLGPAPAPPRRRGAQRLAPSPYRAPPAGASSGRRGARTRLCGLPARAGRPMRPKGGRVRA